MAGIEEIKNIALKEAEPPTPKVGKTRIMRMLDFDFNMNKENANKVLPFILYVSLWAIIYIANHHYGEKALLKMDKLRKEMKDLKADYYTGNAELSNKSTQSKVSGMVEPLGLKELTSPPKKIKIAQAENEH
ncbi:MAG: FtsL-like putative cell division protein [Bacteroidetes bacterium]|nr:FtsL-like putative cell division protein [Bacteroidota bacterium]